MRLHAGLALGCMALSACANSGKAPLIQGSTSGNVSSATSGASSSGSTTSGSSGTTTSGSSSGSNTSGTTTTSSSSTSGTTTGSTTGSPSTPPCTWVNDVCGVDSCANQSRGTICAIDGGLGRCFGGMCQILNLQTDPNNCGDFGAVCPPSVLCEQGSCAIDCFTDGGDCPAGTVCEPATPGFVPSFFGGCQLTSCLGALDDALCTPSTGGTRGFCCGGQCLALTSYETAYQTGPSTDPTNCGACGRSCNDGTVCFYDTCVLASPCTSNDLGAFCSLPSGLGGTCCQSGCVDITTDSSNCGGCEVVCPNGSACVGAVCSNGPYGTCDGGCPVGRDCLYGYCLLTTCGTDSDGDSCSGGGICCGGVCAANYLMADPLNCGTCGNTCSDTQICMNGQCGAVVPCGVNGDACALDGGAPGLCCAGQCIPFYWDDHESCGACGAGCAVFASCYLYSCVDDAGVRSLCAQDADCPQGRWCAGGSCVTPSCDAGTSSCALLVDGGAVLGTCCDSTCIDVSDDPANCGGCGIPCAAGLSCQTGLCWNPTKSGGCGGEFSCPAGSTCDGFGCIPARCRPETEGWVCDYGPTGTPFSGSWGRCCEGSCVDVDTDPQNCRWCGFSCAVDGGAVPQNCLQTCGTGTICANTTCVDSLCESSNYCLAKDGTVGMCCLSGACATLGDDPFNCGACGVVCPPGASCQNGLCNGLAACGPGHADSYCNLDAGLSFLCCPGLGCIDTSSDALNCGACGAACPSGQSCTAGSCG